MRYVYVLDKNGNPMMPTKRFGKVRRMLKSGQAKVVSTVPFTIRLTYQTKTHVTQHVTLGIDPGRTNIGLAAVRSDGTDLYRSHCETRNKDIPRLMEKRKIHRKSSRRGERLARKRLAKAFGTTAKHPLERVLPGCDKPMEVKDIINTESRFNNRIRPEGWLTPTATQLLRTHLNLVQMVGSILPITDIALEINKFAFMELANPEQKHSNIDFQHGALYGTGGLKNAVRVQQQGLCLLCGEQSIEHFHHIVPRSKRGSNTIGNIVGLCKKCHTLVHTSKEAADALGKNKQGLQKQYGGTSVLNQIIPRLVQDLGKLYPGNVHVTTGRFTKVFREKYSLIKDHDIDAYCIAASCMNVYPKIHTEIFEILQFRKHDRANIHCQRERTYQLDRKTVAKNRKKRMEQKDDSLAEWFENMVKLHGTEEAEHMRSRLSVKKSVRYYNTKERIMPGAVFQYGGKRYVMTGQISGGTYYRAYGCGNQNFSSKKVMIIQQNRGLVYA
jgi:hypothetical protein